MKKRCLFLFIFAFIFFMPSSVFADEVEDACNAFKAQHNNGVFNVRAISPLIFNGEDRKNYFNLIGDEVEGITLFDYEDDSESRYSADYTQYTINIKDGTQSISAYGLNNQMVYDGTKCTVTLKWADFDSNKAAEVNSFINSIQKTVYTDIDYAKYVKNNIKTHPNYDYMVSIKMPHFDYLLGDHLSVMNMGIAYNCLDGLLDNNFSKDYKFTFVGDGYCGSHNLIVYYDNIAYNYFLNNKFYTYPVIYIPDYTKETKEDYINAAKKRLDAVLGVDTVLKLPVNTDSVARDEEVDKQMIEFGKNNGYIDKSLNTNFSPFYVFANVSGNGNDVSDYSIGTTPYKVGFIIAKADEDTVLRNTNEAYRKIFEAGKCQYARVEDTFSLALKVGVILGLIMIACGLIIIRRNVKFV